MGHGVAGINKEAEPSDEAFFLALIIIKNAPDEWSPFTGKEREGICTAPFQTPGTC